MSQSHPHLISMQDFLRSGELGPIRLGTSTDELRASFGEPHATGGTSRRHRLPGIWKYGDFEFHLSPGRQRVCLIFCDKFERLSLGLETPFDPWFFEGHPSVESVTQALTEAGITFVQEEEPHTTALFRLRLNSGVALLFSRGSDPDIWPPLAGLFGFAMEDKNVA